MSEKAPIKARGTNSPIGMETVALGYPLGYLILPSVLPVAIWVIVYRGYLAELVWDRFTR
ncbi:MAG: hypothetical protein KZQ91_05955 [Candidatus Thiodiazotropha sp. (ex Lucinoma borealis)]|nr:hypothetical protein [Candidatus Thiodiazotropha sp. (ex Lucinoma borealis)]